MGDVMKNPTQLEQKVTKARGEKGNTYYCKHCGLYYTRDSSKKWIKSICGRSGDIDVHLTLVKGRSK
jgi:hypothetical protein